MLRLAVKSLVFGLIGFIAVPILVFFLVLILGHLFDPRCGTPGDSGGCEMGAATAGFAAAIPGFAIGVAIALVRGLRYRRTP